MVKLQTLRRVVLGDRYSCSDSSPPLDWGRGSGRWVWPHPVPGHILDTAGSSSQQSAAAGQGGCTAHARTLDSFGNICRVRRPAWDWRLGEIVTQLSCSHGQRRDCHQPAPSGGHRIRILSDIDTIPGSSAQYWEKAPICAQLPLPLLKKSLLEYSIITGHLCKFSPYLDWDAKLCMVS